MTVRAPARSRGTNGFLRVWQVSSEVGRFKSTGGMADAVHGLGQGLAKNGHQVGILTPSHSGSLNYCLRDNLALVHFAKLRVPLGNRVETAEVFLARLPVDHGEKARISVYLIDSENGLMFSNRTRIYGYNDDAARFLFFNRAVLELYKALAFDPRFQRQRSRLLPQLIHTHDWPTGFTHYFFRHTERGIPVGLVHNIHNLGYGKEKGMTPHEFYELTGETNPWAYSPDGFEFFGKMDPTKAAILLSDKTATVSPSYAQEILEGRTPPPASDYAGILQTRRDDIVGILNGLPDDFGPQKFAERESGVKLRAAYTPENLEGKRACRSQLQEHLGLQHDDNALLLAFSGRWATQKGIDVILDYVPALMNMPVQLAFIGSGDPGMFARVMALNEAFPGRARAIGFETGFDENLEALFLAGADAVLMPSRFEPCGLVQMKGQKSGTLPIVTDTGGLRDTVIDGETGFIIPEVTAEAIDAGINRALLIFQQDQARWQEMMRQAMRKDYSWSSAARTYVDQAYKIAVARVAHTFSA